METRETPLNRVIAGLTYLTAGGVGFVWLIVSVIRKRYPNTFLWFHIAQSFFLTLLYVVVNAAFWWLVGILSYIPFLNRLIRHIVIDWFNSPFIFGYSIMQCLIYGTILYLAVFAFMGLYAYIPWVSDIIKQNIRR